MTSPVSAIEAIEKAMEGVTPGPWVAHERKSYFGVFAQSIGRGFVSAGRLVAAFAKPHTDAKANAQYLAACSPDRMREVLSLARQAEALQRENAEFAKSVLDVLNAVRDYLPPDGISAKEFLSRVIGAVDNDGINPLIKKLERADVDA
ncbi:hypothetical protein [Shinella sumterensis]|uniref:hypothetical protein n=1 Tax=Shinella sumterensis TaxID=1967501 RepID=UPI00106DD90D|nr:hypothetical protein [Shinella sumterensis]MCD1264268.1 hypothetical protein [Shinella sumterensis]